MRGLSDSNTNDSANAPKKLATPTDSESYTLKSGKGNECARWYSAE